MKGMFINMSRWLLSLCFLLLLWPHSYSNVLYNDSAAIGDTVPVYINDPDPIPNSVEATVPPTLSPTQSTQVGSTAASASRGISLFASTRLIEMTRPTKQDVKSRVYLMKRCGGGGCPYTATWLIHINLFKKTKIWLDSTKMEAASFLIFDAAHFKFQLAETDAHYVHHMSMFEHLLHKKHGFEVAKNKTLILSHAAYRGECSNIQVSPHREFLALVPFYGGLPPNVTKDLAVKSLGQGNSLVDAGTKAIQCMATICSLLKYYGHIALGVVRTEDRELMIRMIDETKNPSIKERIHIIQFAMKKPANLPFHLMAWAQSYIKWYNCEGSKYFPHPRSNTPNITSTSSHRYLTGKHGKRHDSGSGAHHGHLGPKISSLAFSTQLYASADIFTDSSDVLKICAVNFDKHHIGGPVRAIFHRRSLIHRYDGEEYPHDSNYDTTYRNDDFFSLKGKMVPFRETIDGATNEHKVPINYFFPIRYVYYSESDQTVHYDSMSTFEALTASTNDTTFFVGKRREKDVNSSPELYLEGLNRWRECGESGYSLEWPTDHVVRHSPK